jgi:hypothetical protein
MAIDFPSSPALNDTYTFNGRSWRFSAQGTWDRIGTAAIASDTDAGVLETATQAEMETATAVNVAVTPGRMQYHPGSTKAWVKFAGASAPTTQASHNLSSLTDNGVGNVTANFTTAFSSANYAFSGALGANLTYASVVPLIGQGGATLTASAFQFVTGTNGVGQADHPHTSMQFWGDQ